MRLDFNVLWVDDQPQRVEGLIKAIARHMQDEGFNFNPTLRKSLGEVVTLISTSIFTDEVDLILVDWDLEGGVQGQEVIREIRNRIQYKDVVFYSALKSPDDLRQLAHEARIEGIYCASREELVAEVEGVFDSHVKKVLDLDHTRGIVMGATSDIDHTVNECLIHIQEQLDNPGKKEMLSHALGYVETRFRDLTKRATGIQGATTISALFEEHLIFTAYDRIRILSHALKAATFKAHHGARATVASYIDDVMPFRDKLGHRVLTPEGKPRAVTGSSGEEISLEQMRELRRTILKLRDEFRNLRDTLKPRA